MVDIGQLRIDAEVEHPDPGLLHSLSGDDEAFLDTELVGADE